MTIKEAILKSLEDIGKKSNHLEIYHHIKDNQYYDFGTAKTPWSTISAILGDFIRKGDTRVKRINETGGTYSYYLTKNELNIIIETLTQSNEDKPQKINNSKTYDERDLHKLLSTFLKDKEIFSKTIFHEQSNNGKDSNQIWTHPDMVGIRFPKLKTKARNLLKTINKDDTFDLYSYEIKRDINTDTELKKAFFQAVSNSSWANYAYLVAFEFNGILMVEMERLNQSFGIGIIKLNADSHQSAVLFQPKFRELDFKTIDKLCAINKDFENFIEQIEKLLNADEKYYNALEKELEGFCDKCFISESENLSYCVDKNIPIESEEIKS
jgi:uncharacterized protein